ncbi:Aminoacyl-tRNA synthetase, class II [Artemisia annua]|uniref:phenylalanine--tRNA ligase n=1 Tax=Artemisia annua TaxID=35608 RepID=A0A2U1NEI5_ARTAN|nr:Aminoacyl-tRNA synthetase, class II [Artemisia annua]
MAAAFVHHILVHSKPSSSAAFFISSNKTITKNGFNSLLPFIHRRHKTLAAAAATDSLLELGGVKISKQDVVKDEPTNNVPDLIFTKLGLQLHRRDNHPLGILKNAIYEYFDTNYNNQFQKFDDLCPIVTTKMCCCRFVVIDGTLFVQNFDDVLVPADHVSRSYNDTYYVDADTVLRCHTSAHQATLLREGYTNFLVTGDVYRRDSIDSTHYPVFHQLHRRDNHPLGILKNAIYEYFDTNYNNQFQKFDDLCPIVTTKMCCCRLVVIDGTLFVQNFDDVLVPADHVSRSYNDTYYVDADTVLRCHTSAHQATLLREGYTNFLVTGDVYRRDSIDSTHYPVFHQMEGVRVFNPSDWNASSMDGTLYAAQELKACLEGLARHLFGAVEMRWVDTYFPFTNPSFELEIYFQEKWLEVLGCGVMEQEILKRGGKTDNVAWAFGLGLERLAMVLFDIPDIRLFWSTDKRFTSQFTKGQLGIKFKPFSKYPPCYKDMSFWINDSFTENNLCEIVRGVQLIDNFTNKKGMTSHCYRITYRSMERSLTDEEINELQMCGKILTQLHHYHSANEMVTHSYPGSKP